MSVADFAPLSLELAVAGLAIVVLLLDAIFLPKRAKALGWVTLGGLAGVLLVSFVGDPQGSIAQGAYELTASALFFKRVFLVAGMLGTLGAIDYLSERAPRRQSEYYVLLLSSITGMMMLPCTRDLLLLVVAFELMGMPLYLMAAWMKTDGQKGTESAKPVAEGALKLYMVGAASTAITLFGVALVVGLGGATRLADLASTINSPLATLGVLLALAGMGFKIGLVPFHMWVPDTYQGSMTPFVAFLSVAPKAAGLAAISVLASLAPPGSSSFWAHALMGLAALSMLIGNLLALPQTDVRRLLAYSGVAQMGYAVLALAADTPLSHAALLFYIASYVFTNMGTFFVVHAVAESEGSHDLSALAGLTRRSPWLSFALLLFLLSLAGIPFVVGFWAKLYVFWAAYQAGLLWLVAFGALLAVVALFYYMQVARAAYMVEPQGEITPLRAKATIQVAIAICVLAVVGIGLWPSALLDPAIDATHPTVPTTLPQ